jgi:hypothetical protein
MLWLNLVIDDDDPQDCMMQFVAVVAVGADGITAAEPLE